MLGVREPEIAAAFACLGKLSVRDRSFCAFPGSIPVSGVVLGVPAEHSAWVAAGVGS